MDEFNNIFGDFSLSDNNNEHLNYSYLNFFKNPNKLPINNVYIEREKYEIDKAAINNWNTEKSISDKLKSISSKKEVIPALHSSWLPEHIATFEYQEYDFSSSDNEWFLENNKNYVSFLEHLVRCNYQQFWCCILFREEIQNALRDFLLHPVPLYLIREMEETHQNVYKSVFNTFYIVLRRLIFFKESESEHMSKSLGAKYLIEKKLLNLPLAVSMSLLYQDFDNELIDEIGDVYFTSEGQQKFIENEVLQFLKHTVMMFEIIKRKLTGKFDLSISIIPVSLEDRPEVFNLKWIDSVLNYVLNIIHSLSALFRLRKDILKTAVSLGIPEKIAKNYDIIFSEIYDMIEGRDELKSDCSSSHRIIEKIALARSKLIHTFHNFITYFLDETISRQGDVKAQQDFLEMLIDSLTVTLEYEIFICDYNFKYDVSQTMEMFEDFSKIDQTRVKYIKTSINNLERREFLHEKFSIEKAFSSHLPVESLQAPRQEEAACSSSYSTQMNLDEKIQSILGIFPHLGDGFVEKCLEHYDFQTDQVVQAILEENLPPHILDMPFDFPRIPPEPEPPQPILAYRGKKPGYDDALTMLNDKKEKEKMKTYIIEGIKYNNRYENSDDEYDDRDALLEPDFVVEHEVEKYEKPNEEDLVSDTSYSDVEFDEDGKPTEKLSGFKPFCEDPAVVRARYEAKFGARRNKSNVVGKPKGQGQENSVLHARQKKNVQKSSRANHNRKGGAQWKRNKGMLPS